MSNIKPSDHGIVVEHKESGVRYASLDGNFDPKVETKIRDLRSGESVLSFVPRPKSRTNTQETLPDPQEDVLPSTAGAAPAVPEN